MARAGDTARGIAWNWTALGLNFGVTFFLSPFVVHRLGNVAYGVWTVVVSMTAYMAILDMGMRGAVVRFVSRGHAQGNHLESNQAVSAAVWLLQRVGLGVIAVSFLLSVSIVHFFPIPPELQSQARWAILLTGTSLSVTLAFGVFAAVLIALHRFDLLSGVMILQTLLRASGVVWLLRTGHGLLSIAGWELCVSLLGNLLLLTLSFRIYPELRLSLRNPSKEILRGLWKFGSYLFLGHLFYQVIYYTDNIVVGAFISVGAVTYFSIGGSLSDYLRQILVSMTGTFMPLAGRLEATGEHERLRRLLIEGTRAALVVTLPIVLALFFRGETFIRLWMGAQYAPVSSRVLQLLLVAQVFAIANATSSNIALGLAKHRDPILWSGAEAAVNLLLSIILARKIGLYGVALGTVIPRLFVQVLLWPKYICKIVGVPVRQLIWQSWIRPGMAALPFALGCLVTDRFWAPARLPSFFMQIAAIMPLYVMSVVLCFWKEIVRQLRGRTRWLARFSTTEGS